MIARRRLPSPTGPSWWIPSSSGPRCSIASVMRCTTAGSAGAPSRFRTPATPHMTSGLREARAQLADDQFLLVVGHLRVERQRDREALGDVRVREVLGPDAVLVGVVANVRG